MGCEVTSWLYNVYWLSDFDGDIILDLSPMKYVNYKEIHDACQVFGLSIEGLENGFFKFKRDKK